MTTEENIPDDAAMSLLETTLDLLKKARATRSLREIAGASEGAFDEWWLTKLAAGKVGDPGVKRVEALHATLVSLLKKKRAA